MHDGWYWSGDLGYRDEAGFFYFAGRGGAWVRVDSENFATAPVERIVERHPDISTAAAYAVPDAVSGDQVMVAVELRPGAVFDPDGFAVVPRCAARPGHEVGARAIVRRVPCPAPDRNRQGHHTPTPGRALGMR